MKKRKTHFKQVPLEVVKKIAIGDAPADKPKRTKPSLGSEKKKPLVHSWGLPVPHAWENNL